MLSEYKLIFLLIIIGIIYLIYIRLFQPKYGDIFSKTRFIEVPNEIKCYFKEPGCEEGDIDGWGIIRVLIFFIIGLIVPDKYLFIITITIVYEILQPYFGNKSRYIINPLLSITGYSVGSIMSRKL